MSAFRIREARLPEDKAAFCAFIMGSQRYEHAIEPDRRLDPPVAEEHLAHLLANVAKHSGKIFVAEANDGEPLGWGVAYERESEIFVVETLRLHGYISELFVAEQARGMGVGHALIAACEDWARARKLPVMMIGVLAGNARASRIYEESGFTAYAVELRKSL